MTRKTMRRCGLEENNTKCVQKKKEKLSRGINLCCNFCDEKGCEERCLNNWNKCGLIDIKFK